jgi:hypothetical protein
MTISVLFLVGRFLFAVPFVMVAVDRIPTEGVRPADKAWAALGLLGAAGVAVGAWGDVAALVVAVAVVGSGIAERGVATEDDATRMRLVGLLGGAVCIAALFIAVGTALDLTLTEPVLDLDLR